MARFARSFDVVQGFAFDPRKQTPVGHLLSLQIGDASEGKGVLLTPDLTAISNPLDGQRAQIVSVLSELEWDTSATGPIYLGGRISTPNKQRLLALILGGWTDMRVAFQFRVYEYDPRSAGYFSSASSDVELQGLLEKNGDELTLDVDDGEATDVLSPKSYAFRIGIKPSHERQAIALATGMDAATVRPWGPA